MTRPESVLPGVWRDDTRYPQVTHVEHGARHDGVSGRWPEWTPALLVERLADRGITEPWSHQVAAADLARSGRDVIIATGTASGKSLGFLMPAVEAVDAGGTVLYLSPTKALSRDQLRAIEDLRLPGLRAAVYDGDTPVEERTWVREHGNYVLTNPAMLHRGMLPRHEAWRRFLRRLRYVIVDEAHLYRGVFGSHVAQILRRLRRVCARHRSEPVFVLASATSGSPGESAGRLTGIPVTAVTEDGSPRPGMSVALVEPEFTDLTGEHGAPVRRTAPSHAAELLAELVREGVRTLVFVRSRQGAELVALTPQRLLEPDLARRVAAYRGGFLPAERRRLEEALRTGEILGLASTNALELGVDITGLDAVIIAGWPGTRASLWQQAGRAGRGDDAALAVFVARDDPLDTYLVHHPEAVFERPVEASVCDPSNPYVLAGHLCLAAEELPLREADLAAIPGGREVAEDLCERRLLRRRPGGRYYWVGSERPEVTLRGSGPMGVDIAETATGRLIGTVDAAAAHRLVHTGALYLHQGESYLVDELDLGDGLALVHRAKPPWTTSAQETTRLEILRTRERRDMGPVTMCLGEVEVTTTVVSYQRRRVPSGEVIDTQALDLPPQTLRTAAVWWTAEPEALEGVPDLPGALHAAEHASIGLLPLIATCDRWDVGGLSTAAHPDTELPTVFVYDGHPGGAGFAEQAFRRWTDWLGATREAIDSCGCKAGCPSCIQSPKCGNGNEPLDKTGAVRVLDVLLKADDGGPPTVVAPAKAALPEAEDDLWPGDF